MANNKVYESLNRLRAVLKEVREIRYDLLNEEVRRSDEEDLVNNLNFITSNLSEITNNLKQRKA